MGFLGVVKFVMNCFDVLAWPFFALVYPLCASIQAIEIDSSSDTRKLAAYWVLYSLLFVFEYSFVRLLEWIPFWLYVKLIISCWLVIPNFDGAFYVYKHFLCPCLYMDTEVLITWLKEWKEFFFKKNEFESEVKRCVKENVPEASEELFVGKVKLQIANCAQKDVKTVEEGNVPEASEELFVGTVKLQIANCAQKDVKTVEEVAERKDVAAVKKVDPVEPDLAWMLNNNFAPKKIQEISESVAPYTESPEVRVFPNNFQNQICPLCQVTAHSETTWNAHIQGQRHMAALEKLQEKKQQSRKAACEAKNQPSKTKVAPASEGKRSGMPVQGPKNNAGSSKRDQNLQQEIMKNKYVELIGANKWRCSICNASCNSLNDINSHLKGRRHLANIG